MCVCAYMSMFVCFSDITVYSRSQLCMYFVIEEVVCVPAWLSRSLCIVLG